MSLSMHSASVPVFVRNLNNVLAWLDKAQAHAEAKKFDGANYLTMRLAPDMLPFIKQIQIASDGAKGCVARLAGEEIPQWDDTEVTLDDLRARIRKTIDYVQSVPAARLDGSEGRAITITLRTGDVKFDGQGCAISTASASMMSERLIGMPEAEARRFRRVADEIDAQAATAPGVQ